MTEKHLDCRGLACPNPVLKTKELTDQGEVARLTVLVDNPAAKENVGRFLSRSGYEVQIKAEAGGTYAVTGTRAAAGPGQVEATQPAPGSEQKILVVIGTDRMGTGDDLLGEKLLVNFIGTLKEMGRELWCLVFLNAGVKLSVAGSQVLAGLQDLEKHGVMILVCGTCLNHFKLLEKKQVGETTNMLDIVTHMQLADKVISLTWGGRMSSPGDESSITPDMLVLEVLSACRQTEGVFRKYEGEAGGCLLCHSLFDSLAEAAAKYGLPLEQLLADLQAVAAAKEEGGA